MQKVRWTAFGLAVLVLAGLLVSGAGHVLAHEGRRVGNYQFRVGWQQEPALVEQLNALTLEVSQDNKPVKAVEKTLKVTVSTAGKTSDPLVLTPSDETDGLYFVALIPTRVGDYQFHFTGTIGDTKVDEVFDSAQGKFDGVEPTTEMQFPEKEPSIAELQRQIAELRAEIAALRSEVNAAATPVH